MTLLIVAALLWLGLHIGIAGTPLRDSVTGALAEKRYRGVFSLLSVAFLVLLIFAYRRADTTLLWVAPPWFVAVVDAVTLLAFVLLAGAFIAPRGVQPITRHPVNAALGLWSGAHLLANGDTASIVFFGTFLLTVLYGVPSADAKLLRRDPAKAAALHPVTSRLPFVAVLAGRARLAPAAIGLPLLVGLIAWAVVLYLHPLLLGAPALPVW